MIPKFIQDKAEKINPGALPKDAFVAGFNMADACGFGHHLTADLGLSEEDVKHLYLKYLNEKHNVKTND